MDESVIRNIEKTTKFVTPDDYMKNPHGGSPGSNPSTPGVQPPNANGQHPNNHHHMNHQNCKPTKVVTRTVDVAINSVAGTYPVSINFGQEYKRIVGLYALVTSLGGLTTSQIKLGIADSVRTVIDPTMIEHFQVSTSVPIQERFYRREAIDINGGPLVITIVNSATFTAAFQVQIVAELERFN